jgi:thiamine biosynthesis lipoprotein
MIRQTELIMGMPITISLVDDRARGNIDGIFGWFHGVDAQFSPYKAHSEVSRINNGEAGAEAASELMVEIIARCRAATESTRGYFDAWSGQRFDPSGLVKGWSIRVAGQMLDDLDYTNYCIDAGGDMIVRGHNEWGKPWRVGIRHPQDQQQLAVALCLSDQAIATSGTYLRGEHIYDPHTGRPATYYSSLSVIGPDIEAADVLATAAFAMGAAGLLFISSQPGYEALGILPDMSAQATAGFDQYVA